MKLRLGFLALAFVSLVLSMTAQTTSSQTKATAATTQSAVTNAAVVTSQVPRLVKFSGTVLDVNSNATGSEAVAREGAAPTSLVGITFSLYSEQTGGVPLWSEVQNVEVDKTGQYTVELGSTKPDGLPVELFSSAQAQWLGVRQQGQAEQPRIMLLSVPYALKAADAETFGGKPPSAFMSAPDSATTGSGPGLPANAKNNNPPSISGGGTANYIAIWTTASNLGSSAIYQSHNFVGIGTTSPAYPLTVEANGIGPAVLGVQAGSGGSGVFGQATGDSGFGVVGDSTTATGIGVLGTADSTTGGGIAIQGHSFGTYGIGVFGEATNTSGANYGVVGKNSSPSGSGVLGRALSTTGRNYGVEGTNVSPDGIGVAGLANADSGGNVGVFGTTSSTEGNGVFGRTEAVTGAAVGVFGVAASPGGFGIIGVGVAQSTEGSSVTLRPIGVWGDTNVDTGIGVLATADFGIAFAGYNNAENISTAKFENDETTDFNGNILATHNPHFGGTCVIDVGGNLGCTGSKSAVVPVDGGTRKVALYAVEAPENWFEDIGSAQLSNGKAVVSLESTFAQTVNSAVEYHVFLTPKGDCRGLYVTNETTDGFEVRELGGGIANIAFDYRIVARRKGYETIRLADKTKRFDHVANEPRPGSGRVVVPPKIPHPPALATQAEAVQNEK